MNLQAGVVVILTELDVSLKPFVIKMQTLLEKSQMDKLRKWLKGKMMDD